MKTTIEINGNEMDLLLLALAGMGNVAKSEGAAGLADRIANLEKRILGASAVGDSIARAKALAPDVAAILKAEDEANAKHEAETMVEGYTIANLRVIFDRIKNKENWKNAIDSVIRKSEANIACVAIRFFTGSVATLHDVGRSEYWRIAAPGYYRAVGD